MRIPFTKYQGTGNDFIIIDHQHTPYLDLADHELIQHLCDRHFGIGADGLMVLDKSADPSCNFVLHYFNADGFPGSLCGNGSRCAVAFARSVGLFDLSGAFMAFDGLHQAAVHGPQEVEIAMSVPVFKPKVKNDYILDTGSPHLVRFQSELGLQDALHEGRAIRYSPDFAPGGLNVNFIKAGEHILEIITYERGVEDLTLSCGTGAVAAAIAWGVDTNQEGHLNVPVKARGGTVIVSYSRHGEVISEVRLRGPVKMVFEGVFIT